MEKLKINIAAAIMDIIGASFYLIAIIIAFTAQNYMQYLQVINIVSMIIWYFSLGAAIVVLFAFMQTKKVNMNLKGNIFGLLGHALYFLFGIYLAPASIVLCILGAIFTFKNNQYIPIYDSSLHPDKKNDAMDVDVVETLLDDAEQKK